MNEIPIHFRYFEKFGISGGTIMNGEIILDIENLHLKELNEIIIAIENRDYAILSRFLFFLF